MSRSFIPFILALIGLPLIFFTSLDSLFEWQISDIVTDFPSSYEVSASPSPWEATLVDSLNDKSYIVRQIHVSENGKACSTSDLNIVVKRSRNDELLERLSLARLLNHNSINWAALWILIEIALSIVYILWFIIWHEQRPIWDAVIPTLFSMMFFCFIMIPMMKLMGPSISALFEGIATCHGTIIFSAKLLKVYYSVPIMLLTGIFAELAALTMMVSPIAKAVCKRRKSSKSVVG